MRHTATMSTASLYHRHRFPAEIIGHCVWLYFRFPLSFRDVEEMLAMRGVSRYCQLNDSLGDLTTACWGLTLLRANLWCPFHALFT